VHILRDWLYSVPIWLSGSVIVFAAVALSLVALACFHRFVPVEVRRAHNDVAGFILAIVGVIYAVLLAFIAVSTCGLDVGRQDLYNLFFRFAALSI
jgi:hypothetical protein